MYPIMQVRELLSVWHYVVDDYHAMCRVYGYRLSVQEEESLVMRPGYYSWLSIADILNASPVTDERQRGWVNMWVNMWVNQC